LNEPRPVKLQQGQEEKVFGAPKESVRKTKQKKKPNCETSYFKEGKLTVLEYLRGA